MEKFMKKIRFTDIVLECLDIDLENKKIEGIYNIPATEELVTITNKIRAEKGYTDLVDINYDNDVYYTFYLHFDATMKKILLYAAVANGEKDDFVIYLIDIMDEEKTLLLWKIIKQLLIDIEKE